jgi:hypothetical protein
MITTNSIYLKKLEERINDLNNYDYDRIQLNHLATNVCIQTINEFKPLIAAYDFSSPENEIEFFKSNLPKLFAIAIFHQHLYDIETNLPIASQKQQIKYFKSRIKYYLKTLRKDESYTYYRQSQNHLDYLYFTRFNTNAEQRYNPQNLLLDHRFAPVYSFLFGQFIAFENINSYCNTRILQIKKDAMLTSNPQSIKWTGSNAQLIELIYAISLSNLIDNGNANIKQIVAQFEYIFGISLDNYYHTFSKFSSRKKSLTPCLDKLKENLLNKLMDD